MLLDFNVKNVKEKIDLIINASGGIYKLIEKDDSAEEYKIGIQTGSVSAIMHITIKQVGEHTTDWTSQIIQNESSKAGPDVIASIENEFLDILITTLG